MGNQDLFTIEEVSNLLDISIPKLENWSRIGKLIPYQNGNINDLKYSKEQLEVFDIAHNLFNSRWDEECNIAPQRQYTSIELFAGAGGLALGLEMAGIEHVLLNEIDNYACATLRKNRPNWNIVEGDVSNVDFSQYFEQIDIVTGGFPCQAFSYAGKKRGFEDVRGTMFFEFARCIKEVRPKMFIGENVKGLLNHDGGKTLATIIEVLQELGYTVIESKVLKAIYYKVPQKRERLFIIGIRNDYANFADRFSFPAPYHKVLTLEDAFKQGELYDNDVPLSEGVEYNTKKKKIMDLVPEGGYWKDLPIDIQKEYMGGSFYLGGGKTGLARRLSMKAPSLTLVCSPAMKQTERCHPTETRPLTIRESARIQTFPDNWEFVGAKATAYKQIGNAVPVNMAYAVGRKVVELLNIIEE